MKTTYFKNSLVSIVFIFLVNICFAQKLTVIDQDYELAKRECKKQQKLLLIDFYTTWCAPCKYLDKQIFQDSLIALEIAKNYVLLKYDAEKDVDHQLALKYHINMYPTTIVLNKDQRMLNRMYGFGGADEVLVPNYRNLLNESIENNKSGKFLIGISGNNHLEYPAFYKEYLYRTNVKDIDKKIAEYWSTVDDLKAEIPFTILCYFAGATDAVNTYFLENRIAYETLYGKLDVLFVVSMLIGKQASEALETVNRPLLQKAIAFAYKNLDSIEADNFAENQEIRMLQKENKWMESYKLVAHRKDKAVMSNSQITDFCWKVLQNCNDMQVLRNCTQWMKTITAQHPDFNKLDTYARLLLVTKNKKQAKLEMTRAIKFAKIENENASDSEEWLKKNF